MAGLLKHVKESGFPYPERLIHLFVGGSELHGAKVQGTDDLDIYGLYIEPPELVVGLDSMPHFVWSTAGNERRNGPADVDITLYSLKKWAGLACKGNPTALHFLFTKSTVRSKIWSEIVVHRHVFLSRSCVPQFLGFANAQLKRISGQLGRGKKGQRPELEEKYGYDVKAGMHAIRLLHECRELVTTGKITLPRPERDLLIRVRTGKYSMDKVLAMAQEQFVECEDAARASSLPEKIDRDAVSRLLVESYRGAWDSRAGSRSA
jgi:predicted nucleotidyltransferase